MREGLQAALARDSGFNVLGCASTGTEGVSLAQELEPDVVLLDLHLPELGGLSVLKQIREDVPQAKVIMVTASEQAQPLLDSVAAGAAGYLTKRASGEAIYVSIRTVQNHLAHIRQKTGMHRRVELARWATERAM